MSTVYDRISMSNPREQVRQSMDALNQDYVMNRNSWMRPNVEQPTNFTYAQNIDFHGPLSGNRVTQESYMQGRGRVLSKNPASDVTVLPASVFPERTPLIPVCERVDLLPMSTRVKPTCNGIREAVTTNYALMPEFYQGTYMGFSSSMPVFAQTRMLPETFTKTPPASGQYGR